MSICPIKSTTLLYEPAATEIHSSVMALHTGASLMLLPLDPDKLVRSGIDEKRLRHCHLGAVLNSKSNKTNVAASSCQAATELDSFIKAAGAFHAYMMGVTAW